MQPWNRDMSHPHVACTAQKMSSCWIDCAALKQKTITSRTNLICAVQTGYD